MERRNSRLPDQSMLVWIVPVLLAAVGATILTAGWWQRKKTLEDTRQYFESQLGSITALITEATRQAAAATALTFELTSDRLNTAAESTALAFLCGKDLNQDKDPFHEVSVVIDNMGVHHGNWGRVPANERMVLLKTVKQEPDGPTDLSLPDGTHLVCVFRESTELSVLICGNAARIDALEQKNGLPETLKNVVGRGVLYVAIQDAEGILAAAPGPAKLSEWNKDPQLASVLSPLNGNGLSRIILNDGQRIYEGLVPFALADGSTAVLRIGIDAGPLARLEMSSMARFWMLVGLVAGLIAMAFILAAVISRTAARHARTAAILAEREQQARHWEAIGQMASSVAHEVRNPLNTIGMIGQRLSAEFQVPPDRKSDFDTMLHMLKTQADRVNNVVTDFLELGRPLNLKMEPVDARLLMEESLMPALIRASAEGKALVSEIGCSGMVTIDRTRFGQVCGNILGNSLDALKPGGVASVTATCDGDEFAVQFTDNGPGIPPDQLENIQKPFVSLKAGGTGLGLPLVKRYVEAMGGSFVMESVHGKGTTTRIKFRVGNGTN